MNTIKSIKEVNDFKLEGHTYLYGGFFIETNNETIKIGIVNSQSCCEEWGYLSSDDDFEKFVGANIRKIEITDKSLIKKELFPYAYNSQYQSMFIDIVTSRGTIQFACYNYHNGYYGHDAVLISNELKHTECL